MIREIKQYNDEFKKQMVTLYNNGKRGSEIQKEYEIPASTLHGWIRNYNKTQSFRLKDNVSIEEKGLKELEKEIKQLRMENDILKQAALIMSRK